MALILIEKLIPEKDKNNVLRYYGFFECSFCKKLVKRRLDAGFKSESCGCIPKNYKHGYGNSKLYIKYNQMKQRCLNQNNDAYSNYGGRGITICPEWTDKLNGFINFRDWSLSNNYQEGLEIDRIDNNGNYEPNNCRWITRKENLRNNRNCKINQNIANEIREKYLIGKYTQRELAKEYNLDASNISYIINNKIWG